MGNPVHALAIVCCLFLTLGCSRADIDRGCEGLRVMPLGDSITEAEGGRASYRYWLFRALEEVTGVCKVHNLRIWALTLDKV